jgi:hypothetical protein
MINSRLTQTPAYFQTVGALLKMEEQTILSRHVIQVSNKKLPDNILLIQIVILHKG